MIKHAYLVESDSINPYYNLSLENHLFDHLPGDSIIFFLWQNQHTVVIGKNQNAYKECRLKNMEHDHCYLARRTTGGGAVYHDLGNLNFTFITHRSDHDVARQMSVITEALHRFHIEACFSGRNDLEVCGKKISGNAYLKKDENALHHGTLLVNVDFDRLERYLNVQERKIKAKGVDSVRSRVVNLAYLNPAINIASLKTALKNAFETIYHLPLNDGITPTDLSDSICRFQSYDYIYNRIPEYALFVEARFGFGMTEVYARIINDCIMEVEVFSDAIPVDFIDRLKRVMRLTYLDESAFKERMRLFETEDAIYLEDVLALFRRIKEKNDEL